MKGDYLGFAGLLCLAGASINIWGPRSLKSYYATRKLDYSVANFGFVPYGRTVYGTVVKAHPLDACSPLRDFNPDQDSPGPLIALVERGSCHFAQKVLNAQRAGASMVLIGDSMEENVREVILFEEDRSLVSEITVPSLLIPKKDAQTFLDVIDSPSIAEPITLAVDFSLTGARRTSRLRVFLQPDSAVAFDALLAAAFHAPEFGAQMKLQTFYRVFEGKAKQAGPANCLKGRYCVVPEPRQSAQGLLVATQQQLCLLHEQPAKFLDFAKAYRADCFAGDEATPDLARCTAHAMRGAVGEAAARQAADCAAGEKGAQLLQANVDSTIWDVLEVTPLVYINNHLYRGNDSEHLMTAFCASFEQPPTVCERIGRLDEYRALRALPFAKFVFICSLTALFLAAWALSAFYFLYREKMKATYTQELNSRVAKAIGKYAGRGAEGYAQFRHAV